MRLGGRVLLLLGLVMQRRGDCLHGQIGVERNEILGARGVVHLGRRLVVTGRGGNANHFAALLRVMGDGHTIGQR